MDSFEISTGNFDPSGLNQSRQSAPMDKPEPQLRREPRKAAAARTTAPRQTSARTSASRPAAAASHSADTQQSGINLLSFFTDRRFKIFLGITLILAACYMLVASLSFISAGSDDQSLVSAGSLSATSSRALEATNAAGLLGAYLSNLVVSRWFGIGAFVLIFYIGALGASLVGLHKFRFWKLTFRCLLVTVALSVLAGFVTYQSGGFHFWGGEHGYFVNQWLFTYTGLWGAIAVNILLVAAMILIFFNQVRIIYHFIAKRLKAQRLRISEMNARHMARSEERRRQQAEREAAAQAAASATQPEAEAETEAKIEVETVAEPAAELVDEQVSESATESVPESRPASDDLFDDIPTADSLYDEPETDYDTETAAESPAVIADAQQELTSIPDKEDTVSQSDDVTITVTKPEIEQYSAADADAMEHRGIDTSYDHTAELGRYRFPSLELLIQRDENHGVVEDIDEQEANKERITRTLNSYGVEISSIKATVGPTITLYEIVPAEGVRISKIKHLGDDMALNLAALGIRIIAPMPGRGTIGMEVPNRDPQIVSIRSILSSKAYIETKAKLPLAMGTTIQNEVYIADLTKIPHLLVAGATGMGKSVGLNAIIASLLYKKHPSELKFVLIDPKMVEFSLYSKLERHYLAKLPDEEEPIITEPAKAVTTLNSLCVEMQNRLALLKKAGMRNIAEYNELFTARRLSPDKGHRFLPYIVVIIDEFADLLMTTGKELETPVARLAQKARAVGIHLILATQRPSVDVITGMIKNNFPGRVAFRVTQAVDSRTILDRPGAEQLVGRGDMLFSQDGKIQRVQCALIETSEVEAICDSISEQIGYPCAYELPDYVPAGESGTGNLGAVGDRDPLFEDAGRTIIESGTGSTSLLQRKYNIGYPRAGKIMDQLEAAGVVGPAQGGKPRNVLMDSIAFDIMLTNPA